ncbi:MULTISPECIES: hypothetical protein [unclassified Nocardioides]|uniref:hypothetical protein n=1 Tax=unclassified Nocardioides TaxID=2615069 RepID=UPI00070215AF|nr:MULTISPECIES: hypothetical protein [unclassified Nocardioides]KRA31240.1 hypothetical protein ASD81_17410 [Nocardioides sp. Root614]KRA87861.1 hypothetical protein ASD84_17685 [Nocardioides sp. Root682]
MTDHQSSEIPPLRPPHEMPPLTDQTSLENTWRALMGELGFAVPQLWLLFIDGDRPLHVLEIKDVPLHPSPVEIESVAVMLEHIVDDEHSCAFLYARPGGAGRTAGDLAWARGLARTVDGRWPVHLANDVELRVAAPDDLAAAG